MSETAFAPAAFGPPSAGGTTDERCEALLDRLAARAALHFARHERPYVVASYAQGVDGSIAGPAGERLFLSSQDSLQLTHRVRATLDAILVGRGTAMADDPRLTVRLSGGEQPQPVLLDSALRLPTSLNAFAHPRPPIVFCRPLDDPGARARALAIASCGGSVIEVAPSVGGGVRLGEVTQELGRRGIRSVMVEGGSSVLTAFLREGLVDEVIVTVALRFVGGARVTTDTLVGVESANYELDHVLALGNDVIIWARRPAAPAPQE